MILHQKSMTKFKVGDLVHKKFIHLSDPFGIIVNIDIINPSLDGTLCKVFFPRSKRSYNYFPDELSLLS